MPRSAVSSRRRRARELAQGYLYLGIAYLELDQEGLARGKFALTLAHAPELRLDPSEFSPQVIRVFEATRQEAPRAARPQVRTLPPARSGADGAPRSRCSFSRRGRLWPGALRGRRGAGAGRGTLAQPAAGKRTQPASRSDAVVQLRASPRSRHVSTPAGRHRLQHQRAGRCAGAPSARTPTGW